MITAPEFISHEFTHWAKKRDIRIEYIQLGKPQQNAYIERHNPTIRYNWVSKHLFETLEDVQGYATRWLWFQIMRALTKSMAQAATESGVTSTFSVSKKWGDYHTLNDRVLPFFAEQEMPVLRILTDRGTEYCGRPEVHDYQLHLAINDIDHTKTKVKSPQTNGICERFHKTILQEFYQVTFRKKTLRHVRRTAKKSGRVDRLLQQ